jgi:RHS repeat-associated protein
LLRNRSNHLRVKILNDFGDIGTEYLANTLRTAGALANTYTYDSFGKLTASTGSITNRFQYTAREFDAETSVYYYRARYYDQSAGRFLSEDPLFFFGRYPGRGNDAADQYFDGPKHYRPTFQRFVTQDPTGLRGGIDLYRYANNGPTGKSDPFGLWTGQIGVSGSCTVPGVGFSGQGFFGIAFDGHGNLGFYFGGGGGVGTGAGCSLGLSLQGSNANTICGLRGPFEQYNGTGGVDGVGGTVDYFETPDMSVSGGGVTLGLAGGASSFVGATGTVVRPIGGVCPCP